MDALANLEKIVAFIGALVVGVFALIALRNDWKKTGLDDQVTKILLGLMAFGCVLVLCAAVGLIGPKG
jgi:adenine/guanine phosphoribosyltransferase-like PRPP-binding protein